MSHKRPASFKEHVGKSIVARDDELQKLRDILKANNCKFCTRGVDLSRHDIIDSVCSVCDYIICSLCRYDKKLFILDYAIYCFDCVDFKCPKCPGQPLCCSDRNKFYETCRDCNVIYCAEHSHPHDQKYDL